MLVVSDLVTPADWSLRVDNVEPEAIETKWRKNLSSHSVTQAERGVRLTATASTKSGGSHYAGVAFACKDVRGIRIEIRSEEHTSEIQSLMRNSYAVFCLKKTKHT